MINIFKHFVLCRCIVVSTLNEAEMYAEQGFDDILYGYPLLGQDMPRNFDLTKKLQQYHVMINNIEGAQVLLAHEPPSGKRWSVYLKIDTGYHRAGISCHDSDRIVTIAKFLDDNLQVSDIFLDSGGLLLQSFLVVGGVHSGLLSLC